MSRTLKDKNPIFKSKDDQISKKNTEPGLRRRFLNFKRSGPPVDGDICPECRGLTDFQSGHLICSNCGWIEDVFETFDRMAA